MNKLNISGIGMTSQRTRDRLVDQLIDKGIVFEEIIKSENL